MVANNKKRVAVIGSGHAALGACTVLTKYPDLEIDVIDIGLTAPYLGQPNKPVPNAKAFQGLFFPYGVNDTRWPVSLDSNRICSSHAYGGFSKVYSGAVLAPRTEDLVDWPKASIPLPQDYYEVLKQFRVIGANDPIERWSPLVPPSVNDSKSFDLLKQNQSVLGYSRIAYGRYDDESEYKPFSTSNVFDDFRKRNQVNYIGSTYVRALVSNRRGVQVRAISDGVEASYGEYDAVFLAAGCINTTGIAHRSCCPSIEGQYQIKSTGGFIQGFVGNGPSITPDLDLRRRNNLPEMFLEIHSPHFLGRWSHTQISAVNRYVLETISQRIPYFLVRNLSKVAEKFYFAITSVPSNLNLTSTMICTPASESTASIMKDRIRVEEAVPAIDVKLRQAVRDAIKFNNDKLNLTHIPGSERLGNILRGNQLGGWHMGGTLPMSDIDDGSVNCTSRSELRSMPGVFVVDSASFPSIPGTTVALLSMAHAAKVARQWVESHVF